MHKIMQSLHVKITQLLLKLRGHIHGDKNLIPGPGDERIVISRICDRVYTKSKYYVWTIESVESITYLTDPSVVAHMFLRSHSNVGVTNG